MNIRKLKRGKKTKAAPLSPRIRALADKAFSCIAHGSLGQAEDACREMLQLSPRNSEAYNILGIVYQEQGDTDKAVTAYRKSIDLDGANANAHYNLGTILGQQGRYEEAVSALNKSLSLEPREAMARNNLGLALSRLGKLDEAVRSLEQATKLDAKYGNAWFNLGDAYYCRGELQKAVDAFQNCIDLVPDFVEAHYNMGIALHDLKRKPESIKCLERTIELAPDHAAARHMLAALTGNTPDSAPHQFVTNLFDQYSSRFETDLINRLGYRIPERLRKLFTEHTAPDTRLTRVVDLGCGTGLSGKPFRDIADYLAGIDISNNMLAQARDKEIYNDLFAGDLCDQLQQLPDSYDLFIAADVMIYIGNLEPIFRAVNSKASPGAYFTFSVESTEEQDFILLPTGRYAHASAYISRMAAVFDFTVTAREKVPIRKEGDDWIPGEIYLLQKKTPF